MAKVTKRKKANTKQEAARQFLRENWSLIALHTLYLRWGLPTATLTKKRSRP